MTTLLVIMAFFLIGGPPRKFRYKLFDLLQALAAIGLFFSCIIVSYKIGEKTSIGAAAVFGGLIAFSMIAGLYNFLRTPKHLRSKRFR